MKKIILITFLTFIYSVSFANTASENFMSKLAGIKSMRADFVQTSIDNSPHNNITSKGYMLLKKPSFFKWVITSPNSQQIISNGTKLWIYDEDLEQVVIKKVSNNLNQTPYLILLSKNNDKLTSLFDIEETKPNSFSLKPKDSDNLISHINVNFKNDSLESIYISTSVHQYTQIKFSDVTNNNDISDSEFIFKAPEDTDTIDETKQVKQLS